MKQEHVLITGGAGYIGSVTAPLLLQEGFRVTVLDNLLYRQISLMNCFSHPEFRFIKGDACDEDLMQDLLKEVDVVIPLAAIVGAPACNINKNLAKAVNLEAIAFLLKHTTFHHKIIYPCTNSGYGIGKKDKFCDETAPLNPISLYGRQKVAAESLLLESGRAACFRLATVFGVSPRMRRDLLVNDFTYRAVNDKTIVLFEEHFKRNYIHIQDVAETFLFGIRNYEKLKGQTFNVGLSSANLSKKELCEIIKQFIPDLYIHSAPIGKDPDQRDYIVSNEKLEKLGWEPKKNLIDGIRELISAYHMIKENHFMNV